MHVFSLFLESILNLMSIVKFLKEMLVVKDFFDPSINALWEFRGDKGMWGVWHQ